MSRLAKLAIVTLGAVLLLSLAVPQNPTESSRLRLIPTLTDSRIEDIQESPDGTRLLTHDRGFAPRLWEPQSMRLLGQLGHDEFPVAQALMSNSGRLVVTNSLNEVRIWDPRTARLVKRATDKDELTGGVSRIAISNNDKTVAGGSEGHLFVAQSPKFEFKLMPGIPDGFWFSDLQFSPDGTQVAAVGATQNKVLVYDIATQKARLLTADPDGHHFLEWSNDGSQLLVSGVNNSAYLIDVTSGKTLAKHPHYIGEKGSFPNTLMAAIFVGKDLAEYLVCGNDGTMTIFNRNTQVQLRQLKGYSNAIREIRKSPDGLRIATYEDKENTTEYDPLKIWDVQTTQEFPFQRAGGPTAGAFSFDGSIFWVGYDDGRIVRHRLKDGETDSNTISAVRVLSRLSFAGDTGWIGVSTANRPENFYLFDSRKVDLTTIYSAGQSRLESSPSGEYVLSPAYFKDNDDNNVTAYASWKLKTRSTAVVHNESVIGTAWLPDNKYLAWGEKYVAVWDPALTEDESTQNSEKYVRTIQNTDGKIRFVIPSVNGSLALSGRFDQDENDAKDYINVLDVNGKEHQLASLTSDEMTSPENWAIHSVNFPLIHTGNWGISAYNTSTGSSVWSIEGNQNYPATVFYSRDGSYLIAINDQGFRKIDPTNGAVLADIKAKYRLDYFTEKLYNPDLEIAVLINGRSVEFFDCKSGQSVGYLNRPDFVTSLQFLPDRNRVLLIDKTEQVTVWDFDEIKSDSDPTPLGSLIVMNTTESTQASQWLVMDRDGRFDAPDPNNIQGASYVLEWDNGLEPIDISQLKSLFYEPGLFGKLVGYDPEPRRPVPDRNTLRLFPKVTLEPDSKSRVSVTIEGRDNGGIGEIEVFINNKLIQNRDGSGYFSINLEEYKSFLLPTAQLQSGRGNILSVVAANKRNNLTTLPITLDIGVPENLAVPEVNIHALFVGVGDYVGAKKDLSAPPMDAIKLGKAIAENGQRLLPNRVHVTVLTTDNKQEPPNRQPILDWFDGIAKKATSSDIVVVFFAGHGTSSIGSQKGYFFLTAGADPSDITPAVLGVHTISGEDIQTALSKIPASKQVIILDTCHSGAAANDIIKDRSSGSDYVRAYESIRDASGTWILAGAAADQLSYEARSVDHGLLTYALLEAIDSVSPQGLRTTPSGELFIDVDRWLSFAANRVESLRNEVGIDGVQKPELKRSKNDQSFDIGVTGEKFRGAIGLKPPKPIVLMGSFDEDAIDSLGIEPLIAESLKNEPDFKLWLNVAKHPNVFRLTGRYSIDGDKITLRLFIQKFDAGLARVNAADITITGVKQDLPGLVQKIKDVVARELPALTRGSTASEAHTFKDKFFTKLF